MHFSRGIEAKTTKRETRLPRAWHSNFTCRGAELWYTGIPGTVLCNVSWCLLLWNAPFRRPLGPPRPKSTTPEYMLYMGSCVSCPYGLLVHCCINRRNRVLGCCWHKDRGLFITSRVSYLTSWQVPRRFYYSGWFGSIDRVLLAQRRGSRWREGEPGKGGGSASKAGCYSIVTCTVWLTADNKARRWS